jgi:hypothetical protein
MYGGVPPSPPPPPKLLYGHIAGSLKFYVRVSAALKGIASPDLDLPENDFSG